MVYTNTAILAHYPTEVNLLFLGLAGSAAGQRGRVEPQHPRLMPCFDLTFGEAGLAPCRPQAFSGIKISVCKAMGGVVAGSFRYISYDTPVAVRPFSPIHAWSWR